MRSPVYSPWAPLLNQTHTHTHENVIQLVIVAGVHLTRRGYPPVGLERDFVVAGDIAQVSLEFLEHFVVASNLRDWSEWMDVGKFRHTGRKHLGDAVQFHGARALPWFKIELIPSNSINMIYFNNSNVLPEQSWSERVTRLCSPASSCNGPGASPNDAN